MPTVLKRFLVFALLVGMGAGVYVWLHQAKDAPKKRRGGKGGRGTAVRTITATPIEVTPSARGYGVVRAKRTWSGTAQVGGTIVDVAEGVEVGRTIRKGTVLFKIDPGTYQLEKSRSEASVRGVKAQLAELETKIKGAKSSVRVEQKLLSLAKKDLTRVKGLRKDGVLSQTDVEAASRSVLNAEKSLRSLRNSLDQLPASRKVLEAQLAQLEAGVEGAQLNVGKTSVVAPFTMRISEVHASMDQTVGAGSVVIVGYGREVLEVPAQMPIGTMGPLLGSRAPRTRNRPDVPTDPTDTALSETDEPVAPTAVAPADKEPVADDDKKPKKKAKKLSRKEKKALEAKAKADAEAAVKAAAEAEVAAKAAKLAAEAAAKAKVEASRKARAERREARLGRIKATVKLRSQGVERSWPGKFRRSEGVDATTRTMIVVVEVERQRRGRRGAAANAANAANAATSKGAASPAASPPANRPRGPSLRPGMHVEVDLQGAPRKGCIAIPRTALHGETVYVVDGEGRLRIRPVETDLIQEDFVCISSGLKEGEQVVLDDLRPAVEGMLLNPRADQEAAKRLQGDKAPKPAKSSGDKAKRGGGAAKGDTPKSGRGQRGQRGAGGRNKGGTAKGADSPATPATP